MIQAAPREQYTRLTFLFGNAGPKFRKKLNFRRGLIFQLLLVCVILIGGLGGTALAADLLG